MRTRELPQARNTFHFVCWVRDCLFYDAGIPARRAWSLAFQGVREFIQSNNITKIPHSDWDFSRPAAATICREYITRDA